MLGLVTDIKNNKRRPGKGPDAAPAVLPAAVQSWLRASGVGEVELRNVTWTKLLSSDKRVRWPPFPVPSRPGSLYRIQATSDPQQLRILSNQHATQHALPS